MTACSDRGMPLRFSGRQTSGATMMVAASGAEVAGMRMREGKRFRCKHGLGQITRDECRRRFQAGDPACRPGDTQCALGPLAAGEAA